MLAWKWWRDCRGRVLLYCGAALAFGVLAALDATAYNSWMDWYKHDSQRYQFYVFLSWTRISYGLIYPAYYGAVWIGLALAISSVGRDYASLGVNFLLTRPRLRASMVWADFGMTAAAVVMSGVLLFGSAIAVAARVLPYLRTEELIAMLPPMTAAAIVTYGLTMFWIAVTRSAAKGLELSLATMLTVRLAPGALLEWWHIRWPDLVTSWMWKIFEWQPVYSYWIQNPYRRSMVGRYTTYAATRPVMYQNLEPYPIAELAIWIGLGLALVYATQKIMERREV